MKTVKPRVIPMSFKFTEADIEAIDQIVRMWTVVTPPSRTEAIRIALRAALREGDPRQKSQSD